MCAELAKFAKRIRGIYTKNTSVLVVLIFGDHLWTGIPSQRYFFLA